MSNDRLLWARVPCWKVFFSFLIEFLLVANEIVDDEKEKQFFHFSAARKVKKENISSGGNSKANPKKKEYLAMMRLFMKFNLSDASAEEPQKKKSEWFVRVVSLSFPSFRPR